jgi:proline iminopeptidase
MKKSMLLLVAILLSIAAFAQPKKPKAPAPVSANVYPVHEGYVDAKGVLIYYQTIGQGAPLMIVHGGPGVAHDYLMPYLLPLARGNKLIFIDERGSGRSEKLEDATQYTVENVVEDVESVRQALHLGKISLMGHSYGGVLAQAYAFKYQQNLTHLVLGGTFYSTREMNKVLAEEKRSTPPEALAKLEALEKTGLFNKGKDWEKGRYPDEYAKLA